MARATIEQYLEDNFVKWCKEQHIEAIKGPTMMSRGFPDRYCILPNFGGTIYVEFKGSDLYYDLTPLQQWWRRILLGSDSNRYFVIYTKEELEQLKQKCLDFMAVGKQIVEFESKVLAEHAIINIKQEVKENV